MRRLKHMLLAVAMVLMPVFSVIPVSALGSETLVVTPTNSQGWSFNPDPVNATPYYFTEDEQSIGEGSLRVFPIGVVPAHKFIAAKVFDAPLEDLSSVSYDFLIDGDPTKEEHFYLNVYTKLPGSVEFYNCRFDYVPTTGSATTFTNMSVLSTTTKTAGGDNGADGYTCPTTFGQMASERPGSTVSFVAINLGDTSLNDFALGGYFDNVVIALGGNETTYDFEFRYPRIAEISSPSVDEHVQGLVNFTAYLDDDDADFIQWAVRQGTCAAGTNTVFGNVDGHTDIAIINTSNLSNQNFSFTGDMSSLTDGMYCFVYNPVEDAGEAGIRLTVEFILNNPTILVSKEECKKGGWATSELPIFKNQGDCVSYFATKFRNLPSGN